MRSDLVVPTIIWVFLIVCLITCLIVTNIENNNSDKIYNNSVCIECGGHYEYQQTVGNGGQLYIYICEKCDNLIKTSKYYGR